MSELILWYGVGYMLASEDAWLSWLLAIPVFTVALVYTLEQFFNGTQDLKDLGRRCVFWQILGGAAVFCRFFVLMCSSKDGVRTPKSFITSFLVRWVALAAPPILGYNANWGAVALVAYTLLGFRLMAATDGAKDIWPWGVDKVELLFGGMFFQSRLQEL